MTQIHSVPTCTPWPTCFTHILSGSALKLHTNPKAVILAKEKHSSCWRRTLMGFCKACPMMLQVSKFMAKHKQVRIDCLSTQHSKSYKNSVPGWEEKIKLVLKAKMIEILFTKAFNYAFRVFSPMWWFCMTGCCWSCDLGRNQGKITWFHDPSINTGESALVLADMSVLFLLLQLGS